VAQQELAALKVQAAQHQEEAARWQARAQLLQEALGVARQQVDALSERVGERNPPEQSSLLR
jgi:hypothetical protein